VREDVPPRELIDDVKDLRRPRVGHHEDDPAEVDAFGRGEEGSRQFQAIGT